MRSGGIVGADEPLTPTPRTNVETVCPAIVAPIRPGPLEYWTDEVVELEPPKLPLMTWMFPSPYTADTRPTWSALPPPW